MKTLKLTSEQLRYKFKHIDSILQDRNICSDDELSTLFNKFYDVILETNYKVDIGDCIYCLHLVFESMDMYEYR